MYRLTCEHVNGWHPDIKHMHAQHFEVGPQGIFDLEEVELQQCLTHSADFKKLKMHCEAIDEIKSFMQEVSELAQSYLKLAAAKHGIDIGEHFENLMTAFARLYIIIILWPNNRLGGKYD